MFQELRILWQLAVVEEDLMVYLKLQDVEMVNTRCAMTHNCMGHGMAFIHQKQSIRPLQLAWYGVHTHNLQSLPPPFRACKLQSSVLLLNTRSSMNCNCVTIFCYFHRMYVRIKGSCGIVEISWYCAEIELNLGHRSCKGLGLWLPPQVCHLHESKHFIFLYFPS